MTGLENTRQEERTMRKMMIFGLVMAMALPA